MWRCEYTNPNTPDARELRPWIVTRHQARGARHAPRPCSSISPAKILAQMFITAQSFLILFAIRLPKPTLRGNLHLLSCKQPEQHTQRQIYDTNESYGRFVSTIHTVGVRWCSAVMESLTLQNDATILVGFTIHAI